VKPTTDRICCLRVNEAPPTCHVQVAVKVDDHDHVKVNVNAHAPFRDRP